MKTRLLISALVSTLFFSTPAFGQTTPTQRVPLCLQNPTTNTRVYCTGVVPVDSVTGNALSWADVFSGNSSATATGTSYIDKTVSSLTTSQAAGTSPILPSNPGRKVLAITPSSDGRLYINPNGTGFYWTLYSGVTRILSGADCPTNAIYITGQSSGTELAVAEG